MVSTRTTQSPFFDTGEIFLHHEPVEVIGKPEKLTANSMLADDISKLPRYLRAIERL
jgi:hypothetical protein